MNTATDDKEAKILEMAWRLHRLPETVIQGLEEIVSLFEQGRHEEAKALAESIGDVQS